MVCKIFLIFDEAFRANGSSLTSCHSLGHPLQMTWKSANASSRFGVIRD